ncbi:MAG: hypothetical protein HMLKMBBP_03592 [Planctomycetes bacterium]|nr:hypothetical protein [Planctomycetota bacterium]
MVPRVRALAAAALAFVAAACGGPPLPPSVVELVRRESEAAAALSEARWDDAATRFEELAGWIESSGDPRRAGRGDAAWYNAACAHARAGHADAALRCFGKAFAHGLRPIDALSPDGTWISGRPIRIEHVVADPDLDLIRAHPGWAAALAPFVAVGTVHVATIAERGAASDVHLIGVERAEIEADEGTTTVVAEPPIDDGQGAARWVLADGNVRFGAVRARDAVAAAVAAGADPMRVRVVAWTDDAARAAWRAALEDPSRIAALDLPSLPWDPVDDADRLAAFGAARRSSAAPPLAVRCAGRLPPGADALAASMIVVRGAE